jgi:nitrile hydratase
MPYPTEVLENIIEAAWKDPAFKERLLKDPRAALKQMHLDLPADLNVQVHEETAKTVHLVLPQDPSRTELSDEELEAVAGGGGSDSWCSC